MCSANSCLRTWNESDGVLSAELGGLEDVLTDGRHGYIGSVSANCFSSKTLSYISLTPGGHRRAASGVGLCAAQECLFGQSQSRSRRVGRWAERQVALAGWGIRCSVPAQPWREPSRTWRLMRCGGGGQEKVVASSCAGWR